MTSFRTSSRRRDPVSFEPIAPTTPVDVKLGNVRPFTIDSQSEYRPDEPYELTSRRYARDVNELKEIGGVVSARTPFQTEHARFFSDQAYAQYSRAVRGVAVSRGLDLRESARLLGYVWVAAADTMIACWEDKYHYYFWRPTHAIQRADTDGNPATSPDPTWLPLLVGNHPEYPSGHACMTAAVTQSLKGYFGTKRVELTFTSNVVGAPKTYATLDEVVDAIEDARVWGGLHYPDDDEGDREALPADRPRSRSGVLPRRRRPRGRQARRRRGRGQRQRRGRRLTRESPGGPPSSGPPAPVAARARSAATTRGHTWRWGDRDMFQ